MGRPRDDGWFDELRGARAGAAKRARVAERYGPSWHNDFKQSAFIDDNYWLWWKGLAANRTAGSKADPERLVLDALVPAWRAGLSTVVEIPCRGAFTRKVGTQALLVTTETRTDVDRYRDALGVFRRSIR